MSADLLFLFSAVEVLTSAAGSSAAGAAGSAAGAATGSGAAAVKKLTLDQISGRARWMPILTFGCGGCRSCGNLCGSYWSLRLDCTRKLSAHCAATRFEKGFTEPAAGATGSAIFASAMLMLFWMFELVC